MSSLSFLPYGKILDYWYERLRNNRHRNKFLATKILEIYSFSKTKTHVKLRNISDVEIKVSDKRNFVPDKPSVSVIIPAFIKNKFDLKCLLRLIKILINQSFEVNNIIIIDDNSTYKYNIPSHLKIKYHKESRNKGPAKARNKGMDLSLDFKSDLLIFTDVDCVPSKNWVEKIVDGFKSNRKAHIISGNTKSHNKKWFGTYHEMNGTLNGRKFKNSDLLLYGPTCNLAITKEVGKIVKFNESFSSAAGEDIDFCFRSIKKGFNIFHNSEAIIFHDYGYDDFCFYRNIISFMNQFKRYSKGEITLLEQIPDYYSYFNKTIEISSVVYCYP